MPYLDEMVKDVLDMGMHPVGPGHLNYVLTTALIKYIELNGLSYQSINDVLGALEGAKMEFYRRVAAPYEDTKIAANGDVYDGVPNDR